MPFHTLESPAKWQRTQLYRCLLLLLRLRVQSVLQSRLLPPVQWQLYMLLSRPCLTVRPRKTRLPALIGGASTASEATLSSSPLRFAVYVRAINP